MNNPRPPWSATGHVVIGTLALASLVGGFGLWSVRTELAHAVIAVGQIEVDQNRHVVQHPDGGVVSQIMVDEGDFVTEGQTLVTLDAQFIQSELSIVEGQLFATIAQRARLTAERDNAEAVDFPMELERAAARSATVAQTIDDQRNLFDTRQTSLEREVHWLTERLEQASELINGVEIQLGSVETQRRLVAEDVQMQTALRDRDLVTFGTVRALEREQARLDGMVGELLASRAHSTGQIAQINIEILQLNSRISEQAISELRDIRTHELELIERRNSQRESLARLNITAPVSGIVYDLAVYSERSVLRPAEPVLYLVPQNRPLVISARVDPNDIDQVSIGQAVIVRLTALDQRQTPELVGDVAQISPDTFTDQATQSRFYSVEVHLEETQLQRLPGEVTLLPGMPVDIFIRTSARSPLSYFVKPLSDYFARAFRET
jgi:HlyD family secretion protein